MTNVHNQPHNDQVVIYTRNNCVQCKMSKRQLTELGVEYQEINIDENPDAKAYLKETLKVSQAPVVEIKKYNPHSGLYSQDHFWTGFQPDKIRKLKAFDEASN